MTTPVTPPAVILPSAYPQLGSPTFNQEAYSTWETVPAAIARVGEIATATKTNADAAFEAAEIATAQAAASVSAVGADKWVADTNYPADATAWSPTDKQTYRRNAPGGVSTLDPYVDNGATAGWTRIGGGDSLPQFLISNQGIL